MKRKVTIRKVVLVVSKTSNHILLSFGSTSFAKLIRGKGGRPNIYQFVQAPLMLRTYEFQLGLEVPYVPVQPSSRDQARLQLGKYEVDTVAPSYSIAKFDLWSSGGRVGAHG